ncbi:hypothetical protein ACN4EG_07815 [Alkalinema pantanalense CENA528]|uniref:hypothetical protein n=1 Tax=Alkalinema pantanalense TaxID=1620705 RepID=UPI003D6F9664
MVLTYRSLVHSLRKISDRSIHGTGRSFWIAGIVGVFALSGSIVRLAEAKTRPTTATVQRASAGVKATKTTKSKATKPQKTVSLKRQSSPRHQGQKLAVNPSAKPQSVKTISQVALPKAKTRSSIGTLATRSYPQDWCLVTTGETALFRDARDQVDIFCGGDQPALEVTPTAVQSFFPSPPKSSSSLRVLPMGSCDSQRRDVFKAQNNQVFAGDPKRYGVDIVCMSTR